MRHAAKGRWPLLPLTVPYGLVTYLRSAAYDHGLFRPRVLGGRVISVGNLTTGGTGKTPLVEAIADRLAAEGKKVGILTRGYRGWKAPGRADEVQLLQVHLDDRVTFGVGADRYVHGRALEAQGVEWFVLDDGFQHRQLSRDANILVIDASTPFGRGYLLPAGSLREPKQAMARADIIVITRSESVPGLETDIRRYSRAPIFYAHTELEAVLPVTNEDAARTRPDPRGAKWFAFCGIGNPDAFLADLRLWNFQVAGYRFFRDHHRYTASDVDAIEVDARACGASELICTEKDTFNFRGLTWAHYRPHFAGIVMKIARADEFWSSLMKVVTHRHASS